MYRFAPYVYVEAVNVDGDTIGTSNTVRTIPPVEQDVLSLDLSASGSKITSNSFLFLLGFASCAIIFGVAWKFLNFEGRSGQQRRRDHEYEAIPLDRSEDCEGDMQVPRNR